MYPLTSNSPPYCDRIPAKICLPRPRPLAGTTDANDTFAMMRDYLRNDVI